MNKEQLAELLNGRQYKKEITKEEEDLAKKNGLLICFKSTYQGGRFRGVIKSDIHSLHDPTESEFYIYQNRSKKIGFSIVGGHDFKDKSRLSKRPNISIVAINKTNRITTYKDVFYEFEWHYITDMPHSTFEIMKDGLLFCRGIIIEKSVIYKYLYKKNT